MGGSESKGSSELQVFTLTETQRLQSKYEKLCKSTKSFQVSSFSMFYLSQEPVTKYLTSFPFIIVTQ